MPKRKIGTKVKVSGASGLWAPGLARALREDRVAQGRQCGLGRQGGPAPATHRSHPCYPGGPKMDMLILMSVSLFGC